MQQHNDPRQEQLVAAAEALVTWMRERRATWSELPDVSVPEGAPEPIESSPLTRSLSPIAAEIALDPVEPPPLFAPSLDVEASAADLSDAAEESRLQRVLAIARVVLGRVRAAIAAVWPRLPSAESVASLLARQKRAASVAAALGILLGAGWLARPYWPSLTQAEQAAEPPAGAAAPAAASTTGRLMVRSDPTGARVSIDGKPAGVTPLDVEALSLGRHLIVLEAEQGSVRRTVTVAADRPALVSESIYGGFLKIFAPFEVRVSEGTRSLRLDDQGQVMLPPGVHQLQLENTALGFRETRRVEVSPGQTTTLSLVPSPSKLTVTTNVPALVFIDGEQAGPTPLADHPIRLGTRDIVVRTDAGQERRYTRQVTVAPIHISVEF